MIKTMKKSQVKEPKVGGVGETAGKYGQGRPFSADGI